MTDTLTITHKPTVLVVDDTPDNLALMNDLLMDEYIVRLAPSGERGLKIAQSDSPPDLILLDLMMPVMDGYEVCKQLKASSKTKDIPIIFLSAATALEMELQGLKLGAVDFIHKPFSSALVLARVATHIELARSRRELIEKNAELEKTSKLREDIELITRHDLKTPLNAIMGFPQLMLMDDNLSEEQREFLAEVLRAAKNMLSMINNSLDMYKMETDSYHYQPEEFDMQELIHQVIRDLHSLAKVSAITFHVSNTTENSENFVVYAEQLLSYSLLGNLIRNAIEASPDNGKVRVELSYKNQQAVIAISNYGAVPEEIRANFFDKYASHGKSMGTGLGTYSAKLIIETQGGTIDMSSINDETCITIKLPAH